MGQLTVGDMKKFFEESKLSDATPIEVDDNGEIIPLWDVGSGADDDAVVTLYAENEDEDDALNTYTVREGVTNPSALTLRCVAVAMTKPAPGQRLALSGERAQAQE